MTDVDVAIEVARRCEERLEKSDALQVELMKTQAGQGEINQNIRDMLGELKDSFKELKNQVCTLQAVPATRWNTLVDKLIYIVLAAVAGAAITKVFGI